MMDADPYARWETRLIQHLSFPVRGIARLLSE